MASATEGGGRAGAARGIEGRAVTCQGLILATLAIFALTLAMSVLSVWADERRYDDVIYLDQIHAKPLPLKVLRRVKLTELREPSKTLATLEAGELVRVLGYDSTRCFVEADIATGEGRGWVDIAGVEPISDELRAEIEEIVNTTKRQKNLIARKQIEPGMNKAQVQTALGRPTEHSSTTGENGVEERWVYRTYKTVPQRESFYVDGKSFERAYHSKVLVSGRTITFHNDEVISIQNDAKSPQSASPPPY